MMQAQTMSDTGFFRIMASVYNIKLDEADEWDFINAAREDRALVMNDRSQLDKQQERIAALEAENERLWKFYDFMFGVDATGDVMEMLKDDVYKSRNFDISNGGTGNVFETEIWACYDALLTKLEEMKSTREALQPAKEGQS